MSEKSRIGELLLLKEKIDPWLLSHTLKEQAETKQRLVSLLVGRAQLDADEGAMLLSEQLGYPAALQRHLEHRDEGVLELLPRPLGARWVVLPLGRARTGAVVVVARDPTPILSAALEHAMSSSVVLAVTPSFQLERLVRAAYGVDSTPDEEPLPQTPPTLSDIGNVVIEDGTPLPIKRARTVSIMFQGMSSATQDSASTAAPIDATLDEVDRAITAIGVERLVMGYITKRWSSSLLARTGEGRAVGVRGHGPSLGRPDRFAYDLGAESSISIAREQRQVVIDQPDTPAQRDLQALLGSPIVAAPVIASGEVVAVLAVGEPIDLGTTDAVAELDRLVDALGAAYDRFAR